MDKKKPTKRLRSKAKSLSKLESHPEHLSEADSEDEDILIKTGRVPRKWYDDYKHLGYDIEAKTVLKKEQDSKLDELIKRSEDPNWWRTVRDELNNQEIILTDQQLDLLQRVRTSKFADPLIAQTDVINYIIKIHFIIKFLSIQLNMIGMALFLFKLDPFPKANFCLLNGNESKSIN